MLRLRLSVRAREDSSFHCRPGKSLLAERVMSQKQAERREEKAERRGVRSGGGTRTGRHTPAPTSHIHPSLNRSFLYPGNQAPSRFSYLPFFPFSFTVRHPLTSFCVAVCLFCSTSHSSLKNTFVCACMHMVTG